VTSPVARLFGSLANALLDLGLPTIREWLRERVGPAADVEHISTEGGLLHLDGVRIPVGPRGLLRLERASAVITALGHAGLPELRLHSCSGVLHFGDAAQEITAEVSFTEAPGAEDAAWISGELAIRNLAWTARQGGPVPRPMTGSARLFVSSRDWRLDGGRLEGEVFRGHFAGSGTFEHTDKEERSSNDEAPLLPPSLSVAVLSLQHGHVGPFVDAIGGLVGRGIAIPSVVPLDAQLDGDLSWSIEEGGRVDLRVVSASLEATVQGSTDPTGRGLTGRVDARVRPALVLRQLLPARALVRDEDMLFVALEASGHVRRPEVKGTLRASELGFRLGRPRFVPPILLHALEGEVFLKDDRAVLHATAKARAAAFIVDLDAFVRDRSSVRGTVRVEPVDAVFLRDVLRTLGTKITIPDDTGASAELSMAPGAVLSGAVTLLTPRSKLVLDVVPTGRHRVHGRVTVPDVLATGVFREASVAPAEGELELALDVVVSEGAVGLGGTAKVPRLVLAITRPTEVAYVLEDVTAQVSLGTQAFTYEALRFEAYGGRFLGRGRVPFVPDRASVPLDLELETGGAALAEALLLLVGRDDVRLHAPRDGARPDGERWLPRELEGRGRLTLRRDGALHADVVLRTGSGTALVLVLRLARGRLDGTTVGGDLALGDVGSALGINGLALEGIARVDVLVPRSSEEGPVVLAVVESVRVGATYRAFGPFVSHGMRALVRAHGGRVMWNRIEAELCGGVVRSAGVLDPEGQQQARLTFSRVAVHDLPPVGGRELRVWARGLLSGSVIGRLDPTLHLAGDLMLDEAAFPALDHVRPTLARYGLRPPNDDAVKPVTAVLHGDETGIHLRDVSVELRGASVDGELGITRSRSLAGWAEVTLEEEYLRTSKVLTLPRVLTDHIVLPVRIEGTLERPKVHASLSESLGLFLKENRLSAFVSSAVEEAQILLGRSPAEPEAEAEAKAKELRRGARAPHERELEVQLRRALDEHHADWEILRARS
jgi:hypothetical protein